MNILSMDCSGLESSVSICNENSIIAELSLSLGVTHSETLMSMIESVFKLSNLSIKNIDNFALTVGPGSFTGLRIAAATAKGLAFGTDKKIIPIPTLDSLAYNIFSENALIVPLIDARRNETYTSFYKTIDGEFTKISEYIVLDIGKIVELLKCYDEKIVFLGDGVKVFAETIKNSGLNYCFAPNHLKMLKSSSSGILSTTKNYLDKAVAPKDLKLLYLRKSQAQRELDEKLEGKK